MIEDYALVEDHEYLVRDNLTGAIISSDSAGLALAKAKKAAMLREQEEKEKLKSDVDALKQDMNDIKQMLSQLIDRT